MGGLLAVFRAEKRQVLLVGQDGVGKTTALLGIKRLLDPDEPLPVGFGMESAICRNLTITVITMRACTEKMRPLWRHFFQAAQGVVFVVDSGDREGVGETATLLHEMMKEVALEVPLLVLANKQDVPHSMTVVEIVERLGLAANGGRRWHVQATCATAMYGLDQGIDWLTTTGWGST